MKPPIQTIVIRGKEFHVREYVFHERSHEPPVHKLGMNTIDLGTRIGRVTVALLVNEIGDVWIGCAAKSPLDQFNAKVGRQIALGRARSSMFHDSDWCAQLDPASSSYHADLADIAQDAAVRHLQLLKVRFKPGTYRWVSELTGIRDVDSVQIAAAIHLSLTRNIVFGRKNRRVNSETVQP